MWSFLSRLRARGQVQRFRRTVESALALNRRGEARSDGLQLTGLCYRLGTAWYARDIHPWDRDLPAEKKAVLFEISARDVVYFDPFLDQRIDGLKALSEYYEDIRGKVSAERFE